MFKFINKNKTASKVALAIMALIFGCAPLWSNAASASPASDQLSTHTISTGANHTIKFKTPSGIDSPTDTITLDLSSFTFGALGVGDIDIFHGPVTGLENPDLHGPAAGINTWGIGIGGGVITLTPPTNSAPGTIPANNFITIYIGTQAAGGTNQLINPIAAGTAYLNIAGNFGDTAQIAIPILTNSGISVNATVSGGLTLTSISPNLVTVGDPAFNMTLIGTGFMANSIVRLDGADRVTTFVSSTQLTASILASDIAAVGTKAMTVWNPTTAQLSNSRTLTIQAQSTGGGGGDSTAPIISNVQAINITQTSARIIWDTDEPANSLTEYGLTIVYTDSVSNGSFVYSHGLDLTNLTPSTTYHFRVISSDPFGNTAYSNDYTFTTLSLDPLIISNVTSTSITDISALIIWDTNRPANSKVEYGTTPSLGLWNSVIGNVINHAVPLSSLTPNTTYFYRVISRDPMGISATSSIYTFKTTSDQTPPTNITLDATAGDTVVLLEWTQPPESDFAGVRIVRRTDGFPTGPFDGVFVYSGLATSTLDVGLTNGVTYYYAAFAFDTNLNYSSGALDSATPQGTIQLPPTSTPPVVPPTTTPPIPPIVPPTSTPPIPPPVITPTTTPPTQPAIVIHAIYYAANGTVLLQPDENGQYGVLGNSSVLVYVPTANLGATPQFAVMTIAGHSYSLVLNADGTAYTGTFLSPSSGLFDTDIRVTFQDGRVGTAADPFEVQYGGQVVEEPLIAGPTTAIPEATVTLYQNINGEWVEWNGSPYGQSNPTISDENGTFTFVVPNGLYYATAEKSGYTTQRTPEIRVKQNVFGNRIPLIKVPEPVVATATFPFVENLPEQIEYTAQILKQAIREPEVVAAVNNFAAPALITVSLLNTAAALPLFNVLSYLQFFFTQPILLFGRQKKKRWGLIYNSLTKQPVEFAVVRLVHYESRLIVQTRVTDKYGRYVFYAKPGNYLIEIHKPGFQFPTQYLIDTKNDGEYVDIYHGEMIALKEQSPIALNIPLDPVVTVETPRKIIYRKTIRSSQHALSLTGVIVSFAALIISPTWLIAMIFLAQVGFYFLFRRLALPAKSRPWGKVYDPVTKQPIKGAVVRIFDKKFNKLLETILTSDNGRYGFFADKNIFYITVEKAGYEKYTSKDIDLVKTKKETVVDFDVPLKSK